MSRFPEQYSSPIALALNINFNLVYNYCMLSLLAALTGLIKLV